MKAIRVALIAAVLPVIAFAHAGGRDVRGTIVKVEKDAVVVKRVDHVVETIPIVSTTTYRVGDAEGSWADMHEGSRVVVHIGRDGKAITIHLPAPK